MSEKWPRTRVKNGIIGLFAERSGKYGTVTRHMVSSNIWASCALVDGVLQEMIAEELIVDSGTNADGHKIFSITNKGKSLVEAAKISETRIRDGIIDEFTNRSPGSVTEGTLYLRFKHTPNGLVNAELDKMIQEDLLTASGSMGQKRRSFYLTAKGSALINSQAPTAHTSNPTPTPAAIQAVVPTDVISMSNVEAVLGSVVGRDSPITRKILDQLRGKSGTQR